MTDGKSVHLASLVNNKGQAMSIKLTMQEFCSNLPEALEKTDKLEMGLNFVK